MTGDSAGKASDRTSLGRRRIALKRLRISRDSWRRRRGGRPPPSSPPSRGILRKDRSEARGGRWRGGRKGGGGRIGGTCGLIWIGLSLRGGGLGDAGEACHRLLLQAEGWERRLACLYNLRQVLNFASWWMGCDASLSIERKPRSKWIGFRIHVNGLRRSEMWVSVKSNEMVIKMWSFVTKFEKSLTKLALACLSFFFYVVVFAEIVFFFGSVFSQVRLFFVATNLRIFP